MRRSPLWMRRLSGFTWSSAFGRACVTSARLPRRLFSPSAFLRSCRAWTRTPTKPQFNLDLVSLHAALTLLSYGAFGLSSVAAVMYLTQEHDLKFHKLRAVFSLMPPMDRLEKIINRTALGRFYSADRRAGLYPAAAQRPARGAPGGRSESHLVGAGLGALPGAAGHARAIQPIGPPFCLGRGRDFCLCPADFLGHQSVVARAPILITHHAIRRHRIKPSLLARHGAGAVCLSRGGHSRRAGKAAPDRASSPRRSFFPPATGWKSTRPPNCPSAEAMQELRQFLT